MPKTINKSVGIVSNTFDEIIIGIIKILKNAGLDVVRIRPTLKNNKKIEKTYNCDVYFFRGYEDNYARYLSIFKNKTKNILNSAVVLEKLVDKCKIYNKLKQYNILIPDYKIIKSINELPKDINKYPLIMKPCFGSRQRDIYILKNIADAPKKINEPMILQEYIPFDVEFKCYRVGNNLYYYSKNKYKLDKKQKNKIEKLIKKSGDIFNIDLYGLDIVLYKKSFYLLDFNVTFRGCKQITKYLGNYIVEKTL